MLLFIQAFMLCETAGLTILNTNSAHLQQAQTGQCGLHCESKGVCAPTRCVVTNNDVLARNLKLWYLQRGDCGKTRYKARNANKFNT